MKTLVYSATIVVVLILSSCYIGNSQFGIRGEGPIVERKINLEKIKGISLPGSGKIDMDLEARDINANISGSGDLFVKGSADNLDFSITGSGNINAYEPRVNTSISGSGSVRER